MSMKSSVGLHKIVQLCAIVAAISISPNLQAQQSSATKSPSAKMRKASSTADDGEFVNFAEWKDVSDFIDQMVEKDGFDRGELVAMFSKIRHVDSAIQLMKPAPASKPKNWAAYRARFVEPVRIQAGVEFWNTYADALNRAEAQYGVPAEIIVGIVGVETVYGRNVGNFRVMDAITTLAFDYPNTPTRDARMAYFRGELENTLLFARESGIDPFSLLGSYAGAIGWAQFMPSSIRQYGVDFDGNGRIDLRNSPIDAIGSIAHYLAEHGWKTGMPIVFPATLSTDTSVENRWQAFIGQGLEAKYSLDDLMAAGVVPGVVPPADMRFGLIDLQNGQNPTEYWLGTDNFFAITQYNRSFFYAMSVVDLGRAVRVARDQQ
ncbi:lytic murein transglycosylase B [Collimonas arenae]|uniref:Lytic murein transglycosylase B n=1 Tax=Collimonas arenae TaxID=279058 RepID=A0A127PV16_9BURK|nr:lytic murein transglycosylase B [Collimonas arenae]AMP01584.1 lytic murein transglycosylase B [Collimonas arenae]AMP11479.1 lytic murein transglycosylase B [Collimonas arenae]